MCNSHMHLNKRYIDCHIQWWNCVIKIILPMFFTILTRRLMSFSVLPAFIEVIMIMCLFMSTTSLYYLLTISILYVSGFFWYKLLAKQPEYFEFIFMFSLFWWMILWHSSWCKYSCRGISSSWLYLKLSQFVFSSFPFSFRTEIFFIFEKC